MLKGKVRGVLKSTILGEATSCNDAWIVRRAKSISNHVYAIPPFFFGH
jgi:hypothetical protein